MNLKTFCAALAGVAMLIGVQAVPAHAQATRTWVSGVGDDANPCSRTAPCKTFAGAISKTAPAGEINVLDPGGFGAVTITKAISIYNEGVGEAGVLVAGTNGIVISAGVGDIVHLRGLVIDGVNASGSSSGILFNNGLGLVVENCVIQEMGTGITFQPQNANASLHVQDTLIANNSGTGISVRPTSTFSAKISLDRVRIVTNGGGGVKLDGSGGTGGISAAITESIIANNTSNGVNAVSQTGETTTVSIIRTTISNNGGAGLQANNSSGGTATLTIGYSLLLGNNTATNNPSGTATIQSYGNNQVVGAAGSGFSTTGGLQ
jgi:hypothetical protein